MKKKNQAGWGEKVSEKGLPLARIPSNCFLARIATAVVSKAIIAEPLDRPLRSYYGLFGGVQGKKRIKPYQRVEIGEGRESKSQGWLWFFLMGSSVACRTLSNGSRMSVPICPNID